jgi:cytochrome b
MEKAMGLREETIRVWDPLVRIGHWLLVSAFFIAYFTEDDLLDVHAWAGYVVGAVVLLRLVWGVVGTEHARFANFVCSPATTLHHLRDMLTGRVRRYVGHNPAGAAMIVALLLALSGTVVSGLVLYAVEEDAGPLAGWVATAPVPAHDDDRSGRRKERARLEDFWEETHEVLANLTLLLVGVHVVGVLVSGFLHDENLIKAMITGRKRRDTSGAGVDAAAHTPRRPIR